MGGWKVIGYGPHVARAERLDWLDAMIIESSFGSMRFGGGFFPVIGQLAVRVRAFRIN
jgi:hypothetical protein